MSDLSRLLDDVYRSGASTPAPPAPPAAAPAPAPTPAPEAPAWASDEALDDAFADWVPGPPDEAPQDERAYAEFSSLLEMEDAESDVVDDVEEDEVYEGPSLEDFAQLAEPVTATADPFAAFAEPVAEVMTPPAPAPAPAPAPVAAPAPAPAPVVAPAPAPAPVATPQLDDLQALLGEAARLASLLDTKVRAATAVTAPAPVAVANDVVFEAEPFANLQPEPMRTPMPVAAAQPAPVLVPANRPWRLEDDDILPAKAARRGLSLSLRRRK